MQGPQREKRKNQNSKQSKYTSNTFHLSLARSHSSAPPALTLSLFHHHRQSPAASPPATVSSSANSSSPLSLYLRSPVPSRQFPALPAQPRAKISTAKSTHSHTQHRRKTVHSRDFASHSSDSRCSASSGAVELLVLINAVIATSKP